MTDDLIAAWLAWEAAPSSRTAVNRKMVAICQAGLDSCRVHDGVAAGRRAGLSVPDAIQTMVNDEET